MARSQFLAFGLAVLCLGTHGCGKPAGPDQTLAVPTGFTIADHPNGDLHFSRWILERSDNTKIELTSFVSAGAPKETLDKLDNWKKYMEESVQYGQFMTRYWTIGNYHATRYFAFANPNDTNHGSSSVWMSNGTRDFAITISNVGMTRVPLMELSDKIVEELAKIN
jgi:hypothetical protein